MNKPHLSIAVLLLSGSTLLQAANETMAPMVVTATRTNQSLDQTLASVTVITREQIERSQSNSVVELLQHHSVGLDLSRNGGPGSNTSVLMRGSNSNHVLVLIDGVRANSAIDGAFKWSNLPLEQVERIEVVRGPRSTLYGSDAIGGVIQIFTRESTNLHASAGGGSYNTKRGNLGGSGSLGEGRFQINAGYLESDGFSATQPGTFGYEPDDDGYTNRNLSAGFNHPLGERGDLSLKLLHSNGEVETDSGASTQRNDSASLAIDWENSERWMQNLTLGRAEDHYETHSAYIVHSVRDNLSWQHDLLVAEAGQFSFGLEHSREQGENEGGYNESISNNALFAQYQWEGEHSDLLLGSRIDEQKDFSRHTTSNLTLGWKAGSGRLYLSYGTAFKAPTFLQRYYPTYGNPDLLAEESRTTELGYRLNGLQLSLYSTRVDNLIEFDWPNGYSNLAQAHLQGLELEHHAQLGQWQLYSGLTLQESKNQQTGERLLRRAEKRLNFNASGPLNTNSDIGIEFSYTGPRMDRNDVELLSFTLLNLTGEYRFTKEWSLSGRIENLLDEDYMLANGYNTPGTSAYANLNFKL